MLGAIIAFLACFFVLTACDDTESEGRGKRADSGADHEHEHETDGGVDGGAPAPSGVLIHTSSFGPDSMATTLLYVVDELTPDLKLDRENALELGGRNDVSVPPPSLGIQAFFVGLGEEPTIRRYDVDDAGKITKGDELSLMGLGAKSANSLISGLEFVSKNRAYFIDVATLQVIVIDPEKMEIVKDFPLTGIAEPDLKGPSAWYKNRDGDRIVVAFAFDRSDDTPSPLSKVAIIDTTNDTVTYDEQSKCGYLCWTARDPEGNIYFVSHTYVAILNEAGLGGDPSFPSCMVRLKSGANEFDPDYYVNLDEVAGGPAGALMSGVDGTAYTLVYRDEDKPITAPTVNDAYGSEGWVHYSMKLGDEDATFVEVPDVGGGIPYSFGGNLTVDGAKVPVVTRVAEKFSETTVYDASDASAWKRLATIPDYVYGLHDLP